MSRRPLLLDVDTGVDDAMAIALTSTFEDYELIAATTVAGNVGIEHTTNNTLRVLDWMTQDVPVYRGMSGPLSRPLDSAAEVHGDNGLGGWIPEGSTRTVETQTAPEAIVRLAREHRGEITFAFVGPLTNLAVALSLEPRIVEWVPRLVIMGGAFFGPGNVTPHAEFNIFVDPEAAAAIARSSFNALWVGLDVTRQVVITDESWRELADASDAGAVLVREVCRQSFETRSRGAVTLHDPLAIAAVERPGLLDLATGCVRIDTGTHLRGETRLVEPTGAEQATQTAASSVDVEGFAAIFSRLGA